MADLRHYVRLPDYAATDGDYLTLAPADDLDRRLNFNLSSKSVRTASVGMAVGHVYAIETAEAEENRLTLSMGGRTWLHVHPDHEKVVKWQAAQKAMLLAREAKRREAKEARPDSELEKALEPVARAYAALPYPHRAAFEVWVLSVLRRRK